MSSRHDHVGASILRGRPRVARATRAWLAVLACAWLLGGLAPDASAITGKIRGVGELSEPREVDTWGFEALAGSRLRLKLVLDAGVDADVILVTPEGVPGEPLVLKGKGKARRSERIELPASGRWELRIVGGERTGAYTLTTRLSPPKGAFKRQRPEFEATPDGQRFFVELLPCQTLDLWVTFAKAGLSGPDDVQVRGPEGLVDLSPYTKLSLKRMRVRRLPNGYLHTYEITLVGADADASGVFFRRRRAKAPKGPLLEGADASLVACSQGVVRSSGRNRRNETGLAQRLDQLLVDNPEPGIADDIAALSSLSQLFNKKQEARARKWGRSRSTGATLGYEGTAEGEPIDTECPSSWAMIYVNGIFTEKKDAIGTARNLGRLVRDRVPLGQRFELDWWYNPSGIPDEWISLACMETLQGVVRLNLGLPIWAPLANAFSKQVQKGCEVILDGQTKLVKDLLLESTALWIAQFVDINVESDKVEELADVIRGHLAKGQRVVLVCHSQGNFYAKQALDELLPIQRQAVGVVALASPASYLPEEAYGHLVRYTLAGDFILGVPGAPDWTLENGLTDQLGCPSAACLLSAIAIHRIDSSYLRYPESSDAVADAVIGAFGSIEPLGCGDEPDPDPNPDGLAPYNLQIGTIDQNGKQRAELTWIDPKPGGQNTRFQRWRLNKNTLEWDFPHTSNVMAKGLERKVDLPASAQGSKQTFRYRIVNAQPGAIAAGNYTEWVSVVIDNE